MRMDSSSPTPQWAVLPEEVQDTSGDSEVEDQLDTSSNADSRSAAATSKRSRRQMAPEAQGRPSKRRRHTFDKRSSGLGFSGNITPTHKPCSRGYRGNTRPPVSRSTPHLSMPHLTTEAPAGSSRNASNSALGAKSSNDEDGDHAIKDLQRRQVAKKTTGGKPPAKKAPKTEPLAGSSRNVSGITQPARDAKSSSNDDEDEDGTVYGFVAKKTTRRKPLPKRAPPQPLSSPPNVIEISSDSDEHLAPHTQARKRTVPPARKKIKVAIADSHEKPSQLAAVASLPLSPTNSWNLFSESFHKAYGQYDEDNMTSNLPTSVPGASKHDSKLPGAKHSVQDKQAGRMPARLTLSSFFTTPEKSSATNAEEIVDGRPLGVSLGIESPISGTRPPTPNLNTKKPVKDQPDISNVSNKSHSATSSISDLAAMIQEAGAHNSQGPIKQRKMKTPVSSTSAVAESALGVSKNAPIDLTRDDEDVVVPATPALRRKRATPGPESSSKPVSASAITRSLALSETIQYTPEKNIGSADLPQSTSATLQNAAPKLSRIASAVALTQRQTEQPKSPAIRRHSMPMALTLPNVNDNTATSITSIVTAAMVRSGSSSAPPASPIASHSSRAYSPHPAALVPQIPEFQDTQSMPLEGKDDHSSATSGIEHFGGSDEGDQSDTSGAAMEVDAILALTGHDSSDMDDITEAFGTQKLKTSSPDAAIGKEAKSLLRPPSPLPDVVAPVEDDGFDDFYASDEPAASAPPEAPTTTITALSRSTPASIDSSPCRTPDDVQALPLVPGAKSYGGISALTFDSWREQYEVKVKYTSDLPSSLHDYINSYTEEFRMSKDMREVLQASISYNTMEDEPHAPPIEILNYVDDVPTPPWEFYYTNHIYHGPGVPPPDTASLKGCDCVGRCDPRSKTCLCVTRQGLFLDDQSNGGFVYDKNRKMKDSGRGIPIFECNDVCGCDADCGNRVVQRGRTVQISIRKTEKKGWGVFAGQKRIPTGTFLGVYSGEILTDAESHRRGIIYNASDRTYLFDLDFYYLNTSDDWEVKYTVDAYHAGNFTRFLNHSCEPNCRIYPCYINEANIEKPLLVVFATRDIEASQEICFNYNGSGYPEDDDPDAEDNEADAAATGSTAGAEVQRNDAVYKPCQCGAKSCTGKMF